MTEKGGGDAAAAAAGGAFLRIPFVQHCEIGPEDARVAGVTCNLSALGLYIHLDAPPPVGRATDLRFHLPDGSTPIAATAQVTWSNEDPPARVTDLPVGCGLRFLEMAPDDRRRVERLIAAYLRSPAPVAGLSQPATGRYRIPFVTHCTLLTGSGAQQGTLCNLSILGVYAATRAELAVEDRLILTFELPGHAGPFTRRVRVAWANPVLPTSPGALPAGYGFQFLDLSERDQELLASQIAEYLSQLPEPQG